MILLWDYCPTGELPLTARVEYVHRQQIGTMLGLDQDGNVVEMPIYNPWERILVQEMPAEETRADIPCDPALGEACVGIITSLDEAGNEDLGEECE